MVSLFQFTRAISRVLKPHRQYATLAKISQHASNLKPEPHQQLQERPDELLIFVDASVKDKLAGAGVYSDGVCKIRESVALGYGLKSGEAEFQALRLGIDIGLPLASRYGRRLVTVCSDSMEALRAGGEHVRVRGLEKKVKLMWVKAHAGIPGNVKADQLAKSGRRRERFAEGRLWPSYSVPVS
jgi:hypothetical protein